MSGGEIVAGMRVLTVREPWASLIVCGLKDVENRSRNFLIRGPLLIHASKTLTEEYYEAAMMWAGAHVGDVVFPSWWECLQNRGKIIGGCLVTGCGMSRDGVWADDSAWHLALSGAWRAARPVRAKGKLGVWTYAGEMRTGE